MKIKSCIELICVILALVLFCTLAVMALSKPEHNFMETTYKVESGDCLWDISVEFCPDTMNKWDYIDLIIERNNLSDPTIYPGQNLIIYQSQN